MGQAASAKNALTVFKLLITLAAGLFMTWRSAEELIIAAREKSPTAIQIDQWSSTYRGQRWLSVTGRLSAAMAAIRPAGDQINRERGNGYAYVPILPTNYGGRPDPVHAVAVIGPLPMALIGTAIQERAAREATITGEIAPLGGYDGPGLLPGIPLAPDVVYINENTAPDGPAGSFVLLGLGLLIDLFCFSVLLKLIRARVRRIAVKYRQSVAVDSMSQS